MTDRIRHITVTLESDMRDDDAESIIVAIRQIRGVAIVEPKVVTAGAAMARLAVRADIERDILDAITKVCRGDGK